MRAALMALAMAMAVGASEAEATTYTYKYSGSRFFLDWASGPGPRTLPGLSMTLKIDDSYLEGGLAGATLSAGSGYGVPLPDYVVSLTSNYGDFPSWLWSDYTFEFGSDLSIVSWDIDYITGPEVDYRSRSGGRDRLYIISWYEYDYTSKSPRQWRQVPAVPLPASAWLLIGAIGGLGALSWRRKQRLNA